MAGDVHQVSGPSGISGDSKAAFPEWAEEVGRTLAAPVDLKKIEGMSVEQIAKCDPKLFAPTPGDAGVSFKNLPLEIAQAVLKARANIAPDKTIVQTLAAPVDPKKIEGMSPEEIAKCDPELLAPTPGGGISLKDLPLEIAQAILKARAETMKQFFDSWAESIRMNAAEDKKAALKRYLKNTVTKAQQIIRKRLNKRTPNSSAIQGTHLQVEPHQRVKSHSTMDQKPHDAFACTNKPQCGIVVGRSYPNPDRKT
ncbi:hypothetical protein ACFL6C_05280 [Myxococcota bacterium]